MAHFSTSHTKANARVQIVKYKTYRTAQNEPSSWPAECGWKCPDSVLQESKGLVTYWSRLPTSPLASVSPPAPAPPWTSIKILYNCLSPSLALRTKAAQIRADVSHAPILGQCPPFFPGWQLLRTRSLSRWCFHTFSRCVHIHRSAASVNDRPSCMHRCAYLDYGVYATMRSTKDASLWIYACRGAMCDCMPLCCVLKMQCTIQMAPNVRQFWISDFILVKKRYAFSRSCPGNCEFDCFLD